VLPDLYRDLFEDVRPPPEGLLGPFALFHDVDDALRVPPKLRQDVAGPDQCAMADGITTARVLHEGLGKLDVLFEPRILPVQAESLHLLPARRTILSQDVPGQDAQAAPQHARKPGNCGGPWHVSAEDVVVEQLALFEQAFLILEEGLGPHHLRLEAGARRPGPRDGILFHREEAPHGKADERAPRVGKPPEPLVSLDLLRIIAECYRGHQCSSQISVWHARL
jgi:hypothetical protein